MIKKNILLLGITGLIFSILTSGCLERELKINTTPDGAMVALNDEQIGQSPVTVSFNWYGDYYVRLTKDGYETLNTHKMLKAPWYDYFPFDFFVGVLWPQRIVDSYEWTFELEEQKEMTRDELIQKAEELQKEMIKEELLKATQDTEN
ncbi:MAG: PEGA domain-containing protein [Sedimentisphaerales bacterium]|nr:PEGA domain-containing protein [Sedimentisphaerales bacterium]